MSRSVLAVGAVIVLGIALALVWLLHADDEASASSTATPAPAAHREAPSLPPQTPRRHGPMREHRTADPGVVSVTPSPPPLPPPVPGHALAPLHTHEITAKLRPILADCAGTIPKDRRGASPRVTGSLTVTVHDHAMRIRGVQLAFADLDESSIDPVKRCIEEKALGLQIAAPDQDDLDDYSIQISLRVP